MAGLELPILSQISEGGGGSPGAGSGGGVWSRAQVEAGRGAVASRRAHHGRERVSGKLLGLRDRLRPRV